MTPLIWAAHRGHLPVVQYLHSVGADVKAKNDVSVHLLLSSGLDSSSKL